MSSTAVETTLPVEIHTSEQQEQPEPEEVHYDILRPTTLKRVFAKAQKFPIMKVDTEVPPPEEMLNAITNEAKNEVSTTLGKTLILQYSDVLGLSFKDPETNEIYKPRFTSGVIVTVEMEFLLDDSDAYSYREKMDLLQVLDDWTDKNPWATANVISGDPDDLLNSDGEEEEEDEEEEDKEEQGEREDTTLVIEVCVDVLMRDEEQITYLEEDTDCVREALPCFEDGPQKDVFDRLVPATVPVFNRRREPLTNDTPFAFDFRGFF
jgi:hypothetical protein